MILNQNNKIFVAGQRLLVREWNPSNVDGLKIWLDGSEKFVVLNNSVVECWYDRSGNLNDFRQTTGILRPSYNQGTFSSLYFENNVLSSVNTININTFTMFVVYKSTTPTGYIYNYGNDSTTESGFFMSTGNNSIGTTVSGLTSATIKKYGSNWGVDNSWRICCQTYDGTHLNHQLYINNNSVTMSTYLGYGNNPGILNCNKSLNVGGLYSGTSGLKGNIAEIMCYNKVLSLEEINSINGYLNSKFSIY